MDSDISQRSNCNAKGALCPVTGISRAGSPPQIIERDDGRYQIGAVRMTARSQAIIIISPSSDIPPELSGHATVIDWPLPDRAEIAAILDATIDSLPEDTKATAAPNGARDAAIDAAIGLSGEEAASCYARSLVQLRRIDPATVAKEKRRVIAREKVLEWFDPLPGGLDAVGGLENLKAWLVSRSADGCIGPSKIILSVKDPSKSDRLRSLARSLIQSIGTVPSKFDTVNMEITGQRVRDLASAIAPFLRLKGQKALNVSVSQVGFDREMGFACGRILQDARKQSALSHSTVGISTNCTWRYENGLCPISERHLATYAKAFNDVNLTALMDAPCRWVEVREITSIGEQELFDLSCEGDDTHSFIANGIITHNCVVVARRDRKGVAGRNIRLGRWRRTPVQKRTNDGLATAAAVVIFWPAALFVGGDKQTAAELAQMKGQMVAIEQAANAKRCGIQFLGPRPPGT